MAAANFPYRYQRAGVSMMEEPDKQLYLKRWANSFLVQRKMKIDNIATDLCDGVLLCNLLELISDVQRVGLYIRNPKRRAQQLENALLALQFMKSEGLKLVGVGPEDIVDGNVRLIWSILWTLRLRYAIPTYLYDGPYHGADLLAWVRKKIPQCNVLDFTASWSDGTAICHLVEAMIPGISSLTSGAPLERVIRAAKIAEDELDIPFAIDPMEMVTAPDELSGISFYISRYCAHDASTHGFRSEKCKIL